MADCRSRYIYSKEQLGHLSERTDGREGEQLGGARGGTLGQGLEDTRIQK